MRKPVVSGYLTSIILIIVYIVTVHPLIKPFSAYLFLFFLAYFISVYLFKPSRTYSLIYLGEVTALLLIGMTGWFTSPFFYWIFISALIISFMFDMSSAVLFTVVLVCLLLPTLGAIDSLLSVLNLLSLLSIVPIGYFLRTKFLKLKEQDKEILILQENHPHFKNKVKEILNNKVVRFTAQMREPLTDIEQIASHHNQQQIVDLSTKALATLRKFEEETTGEKMVSTK